MDYSSRNFAQQITVKSVAKYALLPGIIPRLKDVSFSFQKFLFVFVQILGMTGLIDRNHPGLRIENMSDYGLGHMIVVAWNNLQFNRQSVPQICLFFGVIFSIIITFGIIAAGLTYLFMNYGSTAHAQYFGEAKTSVPYSAKDDWAFQFLERVFGGKAQTGLDFWVPNDNQSLGGNPWYTGMMIGILKVYSQALLFVAILMILYIILMALADAARTGKPFGESFDPVWAPIRFAIAIAMLLPVSGAGYNGGQLIVFQAAEWGSNLGTNLWHRGIESLKCDINKDKCDFLSSQVKDKGYKFVRDMFLVNLCYYGYESLLAQGTMSDINTHLQVSDASQTEQTQSFSIGTDKTADYCGTVVFPMFAGFPPGYQDVAATPARTLEDYLPNKVIEGYRTAAANFMPQGKSSKMFTASEKLSEGALCEKDKDFSKLMCDGQNCKNEVKNWIMTYWKTGLGYTDTGGFYDAYKGQMAAYNGWITESLQKDARYGWASAGVFYLRMSYAMSQINRAIDYQPYVATMPRVLNRIYATPREPNISDKDALDKCGSWLDTGECDSYQAAKSLSDLLKEGANWFEKAPIDDEEFHKLVGPAEFSAALRMPEDQSAHTEDPTSILTPVFNAIMNKVHVGSNLNPLGGVIAWGTTLSDAAGIAYAISFASALLGLIPGWGAAANAVSSLAETVGNILIVPGFILMFFVPFMPFIYFLFAVIEWVVSVLEAVIGVPLWALTFITDEGNLLGEGIGGVKLLFEIILRPTIIVMSLLIAIIIFSTSVTFFEDSMRLVVNAYDTGGTSATLGSSYAPGSQTASQVVVGVAMAFLYVFGVYSLATSSFKLIDVIPKQFGKWLDLGSGFNASVDMKANMLVAGAAAYKVLPTVAGGLTGGAARAGVKTVNAGRKAAEDFKEYRKRWSSKAVLNAYTQVEAPKDADGNIESWDPDTVDDDGTPPGGSGGSGSPPTP